MKANGVSEMNKKRKAQQPDKCRWRADRCELDGASLLSFSTLIYIHLSFDVFTRSGAKKSMPAGIEGRRGSGVCGGGGWGWQ